MLISDAIEEYLSAKQNSLTASTYVWYARFLDYFAEWANQHRLTEVGEVTAGHVQGFVAAAPTTNTHTRHARAQIVKGFLSWCSKDTELGVRRTVVERIEMPRLEQSDVELLTPADITKLINACDHTTHPHRNRALIHVLLDTGIRAAECCYDADRPQEETGLRMDGVVLGREDSYIRVMGKGQKSRTVGLGQLSTLAMRRYLNRERVSCGSDFNSYVFLAREGGPLSVRMLQQLLAELGESAGVPGIHPHLFRHCFAVSQLLAGTSDLVLMRLLGHTTLESTKIYTRAMSQIQARKASISVVDRMRKGKR